MFITIRLYVYSDIIGLLYYLPKLRILTQF